LPHQLYWWQRDFGPTSTAGLFSSDHEVVSIGSEAGRDIEGFDQAMLLSAMADASLDADGIERTGCSSDIDDFSG